MNSLLNPMMSLNGERAEKDSMDQKILYVGVDVHERESQVAVYEPEGRLLLEKRIRTKRLPSFVSSLPGEKHVGMESVGFIYPIYDALVERGCDVAVANPNNVQLIATSRIKHESRREGAGRAPADELLPQIAYAVRRDAREAPPDEG